MRIVSITSTVSGAGKTTLAAFLIKALGGPCALKLTISHSGPCPKDIDCSGCSVEDLPYRITTDPAVLREPGKDTARFLQAGASQVVWLQSHPRYLSQAIGHALSHFPKGATVIVEGNSFLTVRDADIAIMLVPPGARDLKPSARKIMGKIDLFVINKHQGQSDLSLRARALQGEALSEAKERLVEKTREIRLRRTPAIVFNPYRPEPLASKALLKLVATRLRRGNLKVLSAIQPLPGVAL